MRCLPPAGLPRPGADPRLVSQREDYLLRTLREYRDNKRAGTDTSRNAVVYAVPDADLAALAHYFAHVP